jgi:ABC-type branched-subunit amino acid transport system ATPase component
MTLTTNNLCKHFDGTVALNRVNVELPPGRVTAVVGGNGAGKTTLFLAIAGYVGPDSGDVTLSNSNPDVLKQQIGKLLPHERAQRGIGMLFQDIRVFPKLSVLENVLVGFPQQSGERLWNAIFRTRLVDDDEKSHTEDARRWLDYVGLTDQADVWAGQLSYGQQKLLAIARLLAANAKVLLLDEPTAGIHPSMIDRLLELVRKLAAEEGRSVAIIEHNPDVVRRIAHRVYTMNAGSITDLSVREEANGADTLKSVNILSS